MNVPQVAERALPGQPIRGWADGEGYLPALTEAIGKAETIAFDDEARAAFLLDLIDRSYGARVLRASAVMRGCGSARAPTSWRPCAGRRRPWTTPSPKPSPSAGPAQASPKSTTTCAACCSPAPPTARWRSRSSAPAPTPPCRTTRPAPAGSSRRGRPAGLRHPRARRLPQRHHRHLLRRRARRPGGAQGLPGRVRGPAGGDRRRPPRRTCESVDRAARSVIEKAGYGEFFLHRTGHGLGLQVHEPPFLVTGNAEQLAEGMVFSIEPGVYLPGRFGVRLEVIATVTADGANLINAPSAGAAGGGGVTRPSTEGSSGVVDRLLPLPAYDAAARPGSPKSGPCEVRERESDARRLLSPASVPYRRPRRRAAIWSETSARAPLGPGAADRDD